MLRNLIWMNYIFSKTGSGVHENIRLLYSPIPVSQPNYKDDSSHGCFNPFEPHSNDVVVRSYPLIFRSSSQFSRSFLFARDDDERAIQDVFTKVVDWHVRENNEHLIMDVPIGK